MASQRITVAKLAGVSAVIVLQRLGEWSAARLTDNPSLWSSEQWPEQLRKEADGFAERLRANGFALPVIHFVEWADTWSMGDLFVRWLTPPDCPSPIRVHANRFEIFAYSLPDGGRLANFLAKTGPQQWPETDWFIARLREALEVCQKLVEPAVLVVLRYVVEGSATNEEVLKSLRICPEWIS